MHTDRPALIVLGGPPGAGKSTLARQLSRDLSVPWLCSDTTGGAIKRALADTLSRGDAFRAGYEVLFTLAETFLAQHVSVVVDTTMGYEFQWQRLEAIRREQPHILFLPIVLRCPRQTCAERVDRRHEETAGERAPAEQVLKRQPMWEYLESLDHPDVQLVNADRNIEHVYEDVLRHVSGRTAVTVDSA